MNVQESCEKGARKVWEGRNFRGEPRLGPRTRLKTDETTASAPLRTRFRRG